MGRIFYVSSLVLSVAFASHAQKNSDSCPYMSWLDKHRSIEERLNTADVITTEEIGMGVTKPWVVTLRDEEGTFRAAYKPIKRGRHRGFWESYQAEVAAYEMDRLLGLDMVPPTIERRVKENRGSLQWWVEETKLYKEVAGKVPGSLGWSRQLSRMKMFDLLINNEDRNAQNFLVDPDYHVILIDHSRAFISGNKILRDRGKLPVQYDRKLAEKLISLTRENLDAIFKDWLMGGQIKSILERRDLILEHLNKLIEEKGEASVLF